MSTSRTRTVLQDRINERTTPLLTVTIVDEAGAPIAALTTLTLAIHHEGTVIRARASVIADFAAGELSTRLAQTDTAILDDAAAEELHIALIEWSWDGGTRHGKHEIWHYVRNLHLVPA